MQQHRLIAVPEQSGAPIDCVLFDLDGVVYHGPEPISGAVEGINFLHDQSIPVSYVTNNATRTAEVVADHISTLGISTTPAEVTTSAQVLAEARCEVRAPAHSSTWWAPPDWQPHWNPRASGSHAPSMMAQWRSPRASTRRSPISGS